MMGVYCRRHGTGFEHLCPHDPTPEELEDVAEGYATRGPVCRSEPAAGNPPAEVAQAGREPHSKPTVWFDGAFGWRTWAWFCPCGAYDAEGFDEQSDAMDAAHAHVREHHTPPGFDLFVRTRRMQEARRHGDHTPTWQACGRGICAAEAGHEGTCEEASGFYDWTPEFYDDDLDAHRDAMDADTLADPIARQILAGETDEDDWIDAPPPFDRTIIRISDLQAAEARMDEATARFASRVQAIAEATSVLIPGGKIPPRGQSARITVTYTRDDPDPSTEAWR